MSENITINILKNRERRETQPNFETLYMWSPWMPTDSSKNFENNHEKYSPITLENITPIVKRKVVNAIMELEV